VVGQAIRLPTVAMHKGGKQADSPARFHWSAALSDAGSEEPPLVLFSQPVAAAAFV